MGFANPFSNAASNAAVIKQLAAFTASFNALQAQVKALIVQGGTIVSTGNLLDQQITALTQSVANETTVEQSAITLINGIPGLITDAIAKAQAAGATPAELASLTTLQSQIAASSTALAAAVTTNTPAAPTPTAPAWLFRWFNGFAPSDFMNNELWYSQLAQAQANCAPGASTFLVAVQIAPAS